ncbi:MAG: gluconate 2-dehydrogenase subunit 3 family protein [Pseudomonadota bacterium]
MVHDVQLHRRQVIQSLIALSAVGGVAACGGAQESSNGQVAGQAAPGFFNASEMALIAAVAQTIIPMTDTAGAVQADVPVTLQNLATDWGDTEFQQYWRSGLAALDAALTTDAGDGFTSLSPSEREAALAAYDAQVFAGTVEDGFYRDFKATVVQAYYMSEPGATEELAYEPVPGEFIGCVPLSDFPRTWAT